MLTGSGLNMYICHKYNLTAGPVSVEDYYLFAESINKPYGKLGQHSLSALMAFLYFSILKYREVAKTDPEG